MKRIAALTLLLYAGTACSQNSLKTKVPVGGSSPLSKVELLALQGLQAKQNKVQADSQQLQAEIQDFVNTVCNVERGIPVPECSVDPTTGKAIHNKPTAPTAPAKADTKKK